MSYALSSVRLGTPQICRGFFSSCYRGMQGQWKRKQQNYRKWQNPAIGIRALSRALRVPNMPALLLPARITTSQVQRYALFKGVLRLVKLIQQHKKMSRLSFNRTTSCKVEKCVSAGAVQPVEIRVSTEEPLRKARKARLGRKPRSIVAALT